MLDEKITIFGKFYLKSGVVIEDKIVFNVDSELSTICDEIDKIKKRIQNAFNEDYNLQISFGNTILRGKDISAVTFIEKWVR